MPNEPKYMLKIDLKIIGHNKVNKLYQCFLFLFSKLFLGTIYIVCDKTNVMFRFNDILMSLLH